MNHFIFKKILTKNIANASSQTLTSTLIPAYESGHENKVPEANF